MNQFRSTNRFLYYQYTKEKLSVHFEINRPWFRNYNNKTKRKKFPKSLLIRQFLTIISQMAKYKEIHHEK